MCKFSHLHVHTQYSLLDGAAKVKDLYAKAIKDEMPAMAITDHGNMFGAFEFVAEAWKHKDANGNPKVKPIVGCEFYMVENRYKKAFTREEKDIRYHQLLLAKNEQGYKNLTKLCSLGYIDGYYSKYPRIDKELLLQYHEGLIATSCCLAAEIPRAIIRKGEEEAEKLLKWWIDLFGDDFYIEIQRHDIEDQIIANEVLLKFAKKYNLKVIASNDSHYTEREDNVAHDILLCINTGAKRSEPTNKDFSEDGGPKSGRFAFANDEFYFKTQSEMKALFKDLPEAIDNTNEIVDKIETLNLKKAIMLPDFPIPEKFKIHSKVEIIKDAKIEPGVLNQWEYLKHLTYEGAKKRYGDIDEKTQERIDFELHTIKVMGFAGYFLIVADFINYGKNNQVIVGPGRGSAAGSVVAYCIGITNIDPIKYDLLFERFLNPERASMPDIDTDFDDEGRERVLKYVADKYGKSQVAHIVTYGTMAAKSSIRDVARVMELDLKESDFLAKKIPEKPGISFFDIFERPLSGSEDSLEKKLGLSQEDINNCEELRNISKGNNLQAQVLKEARKLEGTVRNTGIHAAGIIIAPTDISDILPVSIAKDADLLVTQFEGSIIEDAGVIKMDFLGLKTLSIIRDAVALIKQKHGVTIDIDNIHLNDEKTFELYRLGKTIGTFQFESAGMQKYLRGLKPDRFEDLIAMNALYRPGPMDYIDSFIARKHGLETIEYDLEDMKEYLEETYGITVYQEQVMLLSQKLAGFSKGEADTLRKAMGKKQIEVLNKMKSKFMEGCEKNGHALDKCEKIWTDWEKFAQYAFNKSHSTCYAFVAYQTAYLKAHYPAEYMATVLSHNLSNMEKMSVFMDECKSLGFDVLGPDVNESDVKFSVNKQGNVRFGLSGISGVGEAAAEALVLERSENGHFEDAFDLASRVNSKFLNKRVLEGLSRAGAFDYDPKWHRSQYFVTPEDGSMPGFEIIMRYGAAAQEAKNSAQVSMFGGGGESGIMEKPKLPNVEPLPSFKLLEEERKMVGLFLSRHPLDDYLAEMEYLPITHLSELADTANNLNQRMLLVFYVSEIKTLSDRNNKPFLIVNGEDKTGSHSFRFYDKDYVNYSKYFTPNTAVYMVMETRESQYNKNNATKVFYRTEYFDFGFLQDLASKKVKIIRMEMPLLDASHKSLQKFKEILPKYEGYFPLNITFRADKFAIQTKSHTYKVAFNKQFFKELEALGAEVKVSTHTL